MEQKLKEKVKHIEFLYDELDNKEKDIDKLKESLEYAKNLYKKQTAFAEEVLQDKRSLLVELDKRKEDLANQKEAKCEKGCENYNKTVHQIAEAAAKHREKLIALKEVADSQKEKIFCLRAHRNELFEEIDKLNSEHENEIKKRNETISTLQEENGILKGKFSDQKEELEMLTSKLNQFYASVEKDDKKEVSLSEELELVESNNENENLKFEIEAMKSKIFKLEANQDEKKSIQKHLDELSRIRSEVLKKLEESIKQLDEERKPRCKFGWNCSRFFCKFDHSYLFSKVNKSGLSKNLVENYQTCRKVLDSKEDMVEHKRKVHENIGTKEKRYPCEKCAKVFNKVSKLRRHKRKYCNQDISCLMCNKLLTSQTDFKLHIKNEHEKCTNADKVNNDNTEVKDNMESNDHTMDVSDKQENLPNYKEFLNPITCVFCSSNFKCMEELEVHVETNHEKCHINTSFVEKTEKGEICVMDHMQVFRGEIDRSLI